MTTGQKIYVEGVGLLGPGMPDWETALPVLRGEAVHLFEPTQLSAPARLGPAERRRAGPLVRLALNVADAAVTQSGADPSVLATVFCSSGGEGANCHSICEEMATARPLLSPTRFTNSVYNAAAGYWHIAVASHAASISVCAHDGSLSAGFLEATATILASDQRVLLVCYDLPYPEPLNSRRHIAENFGVAFVLSPCPTARSWARLQLQPITASKALVTPCADPSLERMREGIPVAAALPLLQALARQDSTQLTLRYLDDLSLRVEVDAWDRDGAAQKRNSAISILHAHCVEENLQGISQ